jgi:hypothetical protein
MFVLFIVVLVCMRAGADGSGSSSKEPAKFKTSTRKNDDSIDVQMEKDKAIVDVKSASGISSGTIERQDEKWPEKVVLRLNLKGLESFKASNGKVTLEAAVSNQLKVRQWKDGKEGDELDAKSAHWMDVSIIGADGKPAKQIPLQQGYFEITLPKAFFDGNPKTITLNWVDFAR